jgi:hypothetical protein
LEDGFPDDFAPYESLGIDERGKSPFGKVLKVQLVLSIFFVNQV